MVGWAVWGVLRGGGGGEGILRHRECRAKGGEEEKVL